MRLTHRQIEREVNEGLYREEGLNEEKTIDYISAV